jgi:hypothetical protein
MRSSMKTARFAAVAAVLPRAAPFGGVALDNGQTGQIG